MSGIYELLILGKDAAINNSLKNKIELLPASNYSVITTTDEDSITKEYDAILMVEIHQIQGHKHLISKFREQYPNCKILLLGNYSKNEFIHEIQKVGAHNMIPINSNSDELGLALLNLLGIVT